MSIAKGEECAPWGSQGNLSLALRDSSHEVQVIVGLGPWLPCCPQAMVGCYSHPPSLERTKSSPYKVCLQGEQ